MSAVNTTQRPAEKLNCYETKVDQYIQQKILSYCVISIRTTTWIKRKRNHTRYYTPRMHEGIGGEGGGVCIEVGVNTALFILFYSKMMSSHDVFMMR